MCINMILKHLHKIKFLSLIKGKTKEKIFLPLDPHKVEIQSEQYRLNFANESPFKIRNGLCIGFIHKLMKKPTNLAAYRRRYGENFRIATLEQLLLPEIRNVLTERLGMYPVILWVFDCDRPIMVEYLPGCDKPIKVIETTEEIPRAYIIYFIYQNPCIKVFRQNK